MRASDVSIALERPIATSIRNVLPATVQSIEQVNVGEDKQSITVSLQLDEGCCLWAKITHWALDDLNLKPGDAVYAQVKGVSVTQRDIAFAPHA